MFEEILKYLQERAKIELPQYDFSDNSILTRIFLYPAAFVIENIYNLLKKGENFTQDTEFAKSLAKTFQIPFTSEIIEPGEITLILEDVTNIEIPKGTLIQQIDNPNLTAVVADDVFLTQEEVEQMIGNDIPIKVKFNGNLELNKDVIFEIPIKNLTSAIVTKISINLPATNPDDVINSILSQRPFIYGMTTYAGILSYLNQYNPQIVPPLSHDNPSVVFDLSKSRKIRKFVLGNVNTENKTVELTDFEYEIPENQPLTIDLVLDIPY
jgi:hypothetical protein